MGSFNISQLMRKQRTSKQALRVAATCIIDVTSLATSRASSFFLPFLRAPMVVQYSGVHFVARKLVNTSHSWSVFLQVDAVQKYLKRCARPRYFVLPWSVPGGLCRENSRARNFQRRYSLLRFRAAKPPWKNTTAHHPRVAIIDAPLPPTTAWLRDLLTSNHVTYSKQWDHTIVAAKANERNCLRGLYRKTDNATRPNTQHQRSGNKTCKPITQPLLTRIRTR